MRRLLAIALLIPASCGGKVDGRAGYRELPGLSPCAPGPDPVEVAVRAYTGDCAAAPAAQPKLEISTAVSGERRVVVLTRRELEDDSIRDERVRYELARVPDGDTWQIVWAGEQHRCWPGRGHEDFGTAPCN